MKRLWLSGLIVWAGFVASASGQEAGWRPAAPRPLPLAGTEGVPLPRAPGVSLGRPEPLQAAEVPHQDRGVIRTSVSSPPGVRLLRAKLLDDLPAPPSGSGPAGEPEAQTAVSAAANLHVLSPTLFASDPPCETPADPTAASCPAAAGCPAACASGQVCVNGVPLSRTEIYFDPDTGPGGVSSAWRASYAPATRFYASAEYLLWWVKGFDTPVLVTTSPESTPQNLQGVLGQPTTTVLFGGDRFRPDGQSGGRFRVGYWLDPCGVWAVEASGFFLGEQRDTFALASPQPPVIGRPFFLRDITGAISQSAELVATPGNNPGDLFSTQGNIRVDTASRFWGAEANVRRNVCCGCDYRVDLLAGYRYLSLREELQITEDLINLRAIPPVGRNVGDRIVVSDRFATRNEFHGGQVGAIAEWRRGPWSIEGTFKIALGNVHQVVDISGFTNITPATGGPVISIPAGLLALASNSGTFSRDRFAVAPEVGLKFGYQLTDNVRAFVGYNFLYLSSVVRPGDQIDTVLDVNQIPPFFAGTPPAPARPLVPFRTTDFWAQGLSVGVEVRY